MATTEIRAGEVVFGVQAPVWNEVVGALRPHICSDDTRPVLTMVRVRTHRGEVAIDATDSYSAIRVRFMADDALINSALPALDVLVPGEDLCSLRPPKDRRVDFRLVRPDIVVEADGDNPRTLIDAGASEVTDHTTTVRLAHPEFAIDYPFPDLDAMLSGPALPEGPRALRISPVQMAKLAKLPKSPFATIFRGWGRPILMFGHGRAVAEAAGSASYSVAFMPGDASDTTPEELAQEAMWEPWAGDADGE